MQFSNLWFENTFDTIDLPRVLLNIHNIGIRGNALNRLESFLEGRTQCVLVDERSSGFEDVKYGVPQGSILGPLLFIILINDLQATCKIIQSTFFADDTNRLFPLNKPLNKEAETMNCNLLMGRWQTVSLHWIWTRQTACCSRQKSKKEPTSWMSREVSDSVTLFWFLPHHQFFLDH